MRRVGVHCERPPSGLTSQENQLGLGAIDLDHPASTQSRRSMVARWLQRSDFGVVVICRRRLKTKSTAGTDDPLKTGRFTVRHALVVRSSAGAKKLVNTPCDPLEKTLAGVVCHRKAVIDNHRTTNLSFAKAEPRGFTGSTYPTAASLLRLF